MPAKSSPEHTIPAVHVLQLVDLVKRWQVTERDLLAGSKLRAQDVRDPEVTVPLDTALSIMERARKLTAEPGLGVYLGLRSGMAGHGYLGFAAMSAPTFGDAIALMIRYVQIRSTAFSFRGSREGDDDGIGVLTIDEHADFGSARDIILLSLMVGMRQGAAALTGRDVQTSMGIDFAMPRPAYFDRFEQALPLIRFDQPANRLFGPITNLGKPLAFADPAGLELAKQQCERLLTSLGLDGRFAPKVRALLARSEGSLDSLEDVASELGLSKRTLRRRLDEERAPFATLLKEARKEKAVALLGTRELSIEDVALKLGYSTVAAFTRAFSGWAGMTPSEFRKRNAAASK